MTRRRQAAALAAAVAFLVSPSPVAAQQLTDDGCLYLTGSTTCPGFEGSYVAPTNLSDTWSFFSRVYDIQDFDRYALQYINNVAKTKLADQMGCDDAASTIIRYERTVLCARWTNNASSLACATQYLGSTTSTKQICASTCEQNHQSMQDIASNSTICGRDRTGGDRTDQIAADYNACTSIASDASTCISGDMNEHNCGFANSTTQVCAMCSTTPERCCTEPNFDISGLCNLDAAALSSSAAANTATPTSSAGAANSGSRKSGLGGGAIAGIVVGVIAGIAILAAIAFLLWRRKRKNTNKAGGRLLQSPTEKNNHGWGARSTETPVQNSPETTNAPVISDAPVTSNYGAHPNSPPAAMNNLAAAEPAGGVAKGPTGTATGPNFAATPSDPVQSTGSHHGGAIAGAAAAGAAVAGAGAMATGKHRRDAPSPPAAKRNVSPPSPISAPKHSTQMAAMPQPHPAQPPASPPRPLPTIPGAGAPTSPTSAYSPTSSHGPMSSQSHAGGRSLPSPPRALPHTPAPQAALAAPPQAGAPQAVPPQAAPPQAPATNFAAAPPQAQATNFAAAPPPPPAAAPQTGSSNMAGVGAGAAAAAAASAAAGSDTTRLQRLELPKGSGIWIEEGSRVVAQHPYKAALVDELTLEPGVQIVVQEIYDDGWARGVVSAGGDPNQVGRVGQFPTVCVTKA